MKSPNLRSLRQHLAHRKLQDYRRDRDAADWHVEEGLDEWFLPDPNQPVHPFHPYKEWDWRLDAWLRSYDGRQRWGRGWREKETCPCCQQDYASTFEFGLAHPRGPRDFEIAVLLLLDGAWPTGEPCAAEVLQGFREILDSVPVPPADPRRTPEAEPVATPPEMHAVALSAADGRVIEWYENLYRDGPEPLLAAIAAQPQEWVAFRRLRQRVVSTMKTAAPRDRRFDEDFEVERATLLAMLTFPMWRGSLATWPGGTGAELLRHLLAPRKPMPALFEAVMDDVYDSSNHLDVRPSGNRRVRDSVADPLLWLVAEAQGASMRRIARCYGTSLSTALIAALHALSAAVGEHGEDEQWRPCCMSSLLERAKVHQLGGNDVDWRRICWMGYRDGVWEYAPLWRSAVAWLVRWRDQLTDEQAERAMRWGIHCYLEDQGFSFAGRSAAAVLAREEEYQREIARRAAAARAAALEAYQRVRDNLSVSGHLRWEAQGWDLSWQDDAGVAWQVRELTDEHQLAEEGAAQNHCVGAYAHSCAEGASAIVQMRRNDQRVATIQVRLADRCIVQARGRFNAPLGAAAIHALGYWAERFELIFSQR